MITDIQWDVDHQPNSRVKLEGTYRNEGYRDFQSSAKVQFLERVYAALIEHVSRDKYKTRAELQWAANKKVGIELEFENNHGINYRRFNAVVGVMTPFEHLDLTRAAVSYQENPRKISSSVSFTYDGGKQIRVGFEGKRPLSIRFIDVNFDFVMPFGPSSLHLSHILSEDWNKQSGLIDVEWAQTNYFKLETNGEYFFRNRMHNVKRNIGIHTSILNYERITVNVTHHNNANQFDSKAVYNKNGETYLYNLKMDVNKKGSQYQSTGQLI